MAKKELVLPYTAKRLTEFFESPFQIYEDRVDKCKRLFLTEEDASKWFYARDNKVMTAEIAALEFAHGTIPGTEQYRLSFTVLNIDDASTYGSTAKLRFSFSTVDTLNNNIPTEEPVEIFFTFSSDAGTKQISKIFTYIDGVTEFDITDYIEPDENRITMVVRGRSSGLTVSSNATYTAVYLPFSSNFDITAERLVGANFGIPYSVSGIGDKVVEFVIDSGAPFNDTAYDGTVSKTYSYINRLAAGKHTLQMKAKTTINNRVFESKLLYFEFVVGGMGLFLTTTVIKAEFPSGTSYFMERNPGLVGEQYVDYTLAWAYYSTTQPNATIIWKTKLNGVETIVGSREVDEKEGTVGVMPDPVIFQPDTVGNYDLYAYIKGSELEHIGQYTINVVENTAGLREAEGYTMKLDAKGRSNGEPDETKFDWSSNGFTTTFNEKMTFDGLAGYTGLAVRLDNGATAVNTCKPFAVENGVLVNGAAVSFHFRTRNVEDENVPLIEIGDKNAVSTAYFAIYGKKVYLRPSNGKALEYEFASEEDTHLAVVIHPKTGVTDSQMMFFIFNGVEAPGSAYGDTAVFNIGTTADASDTNGMIRMGTATGKAAIDIYGIRVYANMLSMWQGMNNFMIDKGGNVGQMMRKNNIFVNNDFNRPNINRIKEQYRVLEVIGDLGKLESSSKKENFYGSVIYTDPFNPKFNFERMDGGAYIETAGQSRLEDLMAKSFHLDMNEDDTPALYQDGKLCHKNRFIFAEGNIPENGVRIDLSGADSSICRNASHMKMVNRFYPYIDINGEYVLRTPPQRYALSGKWSEDMARLYGGTKDDYPWQYNINFAPDSVPIIVVWHQQADDPIQVYGLAQMTEEKKASYANGNHSIYLKAPLSDGTLDPLDRYSGTKGERGWDNEGVIEVEYVNPSDLTNNVSTAGFFDEGTRDYSFELCFPKKKDLLNGGAEVWQIFHDEFLVPLTATYGNQALFDQTVADVLYLPSFAMYYNKVLDKKMNDSLCRNMHVIRYNMGTAENPKWQWWAKWWDADVCCGLFQSNAMGVDPATDRTYTDDNGMYIMAGHDMWIWNALEQNEVFKTLCKSIAVASFAAGWSVDTEIEEQDKITESYSESLYNLDGLLKFLYAYRKGNDYMIRMQGSSTPYRHGFLKESYNIREAQMAIGQYASRSVSFRATGATYPSKVSILAAAHTWFGLGTTSTNIVTGIEKSPEDGVFDIQIPQGMELGRDFLSVYGADKIRKIDISDFLPYLTVQINVGNLAQVQELMIGYPNHTKVSTLGFNQDTSVSFTGVENMSRLLKLSLVGLLGVHDFPLTSLNHLTHFYAAGTGLLAFRPENGTKFVEVTLPDTLQTIEVRDVQLGDISFWSTDVEAKTLTRMESCPESLLNLTLIGMGEDEGTHNLVHKWLRMLADHPYLCQTAQISYRAINWMGVDVEDLFVLAQIPPSQRNITGYIRCSTEFTPDQMNLLMAAFGSNIFSPDNTLVIDCESRNIIISAAGSNTSVTEDGIVEVLQGTSAQLKAVGFPVKGSNPIYRWFIRQGGELIGGDEEMPDINFDHSVLNYVTGTLSTLECADPDKLYEIYCENTRTLANGTVHVRVKARTYPTEVNLELAKALGTISEVEGVYQILSIGKYFFDANHRRMVDGIEFEYNGTMNDEDGGVWEADGLGSFASRSTTDFLNGRTSFDEYCLQIASMPQDEVTIRLRYTSNWKSGLVLVASPLEIALVTTIYQLLTTSRQTGNPALFAAIEATGAPHADENSYDSMELKSVTGTLHFAQLLTSAGMDPSSLTHFNSSGKDILRFLKNVTGLDCSDCTGLIGILNVDPMTSIIEVDTRNTGITEIQGIENKSRLNSVGLHVPEKLVIKNCPNVSYGSLDVQGNSVSSDSIAISDVRELAEIVVTDAASPDVLSFVSAIVGVQAEAEEQAEDEQIENE